MPQTRPDMSMGAIQVLIGLLGFEHGDMSYIPSIQVKPSGSSLRFLGFVAHSLASQVQIQMLMMDPLLQTLVQGVTHGFIEAS